jgi:hypothetical protein
MGGQDPHTFLEMRSTLTRVFVILAAPIYGEIFDELECSSAGEMRVDVDFDVLVLLYASQINYSDSIRLAELRLEDLIQ